MMIPTIGITPPRSDTLLERALYLAVGLVLAESIDGPDGGGNPADERHLQEQAEEARDRAADREEGQPRKKQRDQKPPGNLQRAGRIARWAPRPAAKIALAIFAHRTKTGQGTFNIRRPA